MSHVFRNVMNNKILWSMLSGCLLAAAVGCSTGEGLHSAYMQPRIEGRVIDADTQMPIERVVVLRNPQATVAGNDDYISAGEVQEEQHTVYTDKEGSFKVPSEKDLEMGGDRTWTSVTLKFVHPDYQMYSTNFVYGGGTDGDGEPLFQTGDIVLHRLPVHAGEWK